MEEIVKERAENHQMDISKTSADSKVKSVVKVVDDKVDNADQEKVGVMQAGWKTDMREAEERPQGWKQREAEEKVEGWKQNMREAEDTKPLGWNADMREVEEKMQGWNPQMRANEEEMAENELE